MKRDRNESTAMIISLLLCLGILLAVILINYILLKKPSFYIDLRQYPVYGREGFEPGFAGDETAVPWKLIAPAGDRELVIVKEKFDVPHGVFLSPFGQSPKEFTYRTIFELPPDICLKFDADKTVTPGLFLAAIGDNWEVYLNGTLIRSEVYLNKEGEITSHRAQRKVRFPFDNGLLHSGTNVLDFRLIGDPNHDNLGFFYGIPHYITYYSYIDKVSGEYFSMALIGIYFFVGIYHLLLFMMRRKERYNLFFSLFSVVLGLYFITRTSIIYRINPNTNIWARIEFAALFMVAPLLGAFFDELIRQRLLLPTKIYMAACLVLSLAECLFAPQFGEDAIWLWWPSMAVWIVYIFVLNFGYSFFYRIYRNWKTNRLAAANAVEAGTAGERRSLLKEFIVQIGATPLGNIALGLFVVFLTSGFDIIDSIFLNIGILTSIYGFTVFTLGIAFILARKFGELYNQLNLANITLEGTVRERTRELEEQTIIAQSASKAKTVFLANMSHEIRTPLNAILGFSELNLLDSSAKKDRGILKKIHNSASYLLKIINDILDITKIETGKLELYQREYELPSLLNEVITLNTIRIGNKPISFKLDLDENLPLRLYGDDIRIRQILNNVLTNAFKYTNEGTVSLSCYPAAPEANPRQGEIGLEFTVADTGIGIKAENIRAIFSRYDQGSVLEHRNIEGTGLGLDITRQLAELMGGGIKAESEYGKGSVFTVIVRQQIVSSKPIGREIAEALKNLSYKNRDIEMKNFRRSQMPRVRVLVVDDLPVNLEVARGFLNLYGMQVDCAQSGEEAIRILREKSALFDLVFTDYVMPGTDGPAVLKALRNDIGGIYGGSLPVIALSASALAGSGEMFLEMGFQDFLSKPIDALNLDRILKKWIPEQKIEEAASPDAALDGLSVSDAGQKIRYPSAVPNASTIIIEGINTIAGIENSDGNEDGYLYMLDSFCRDSDEKTNVLRHLMYHFKTAGDFEKSSGNTIAILEMILQTMKNSAVSIGAKTIAEEAAVLEDNLKTKNWTALVSSLPDFYGHLQSATDRIREKLGLLPND